MYSTVFWCLLVVLLDFVALLHNHCYPLPGGGTSHMKGVGMLVVSPHPWYVLNYFTPFPRNVSLGRLWLQATVETLHREPTLFFVNCKWKLNKERKSYLFCSILESAVVRSEMEVVLRC